MVSLEQIRSVRVQGSAVFDWVATYFAAYLALKYAPNFIYGTLGFRSPVQWYAVMVPLAVAAHWASGTRTHMVEELDRPGMNIFKVLLWVSIFIVLLEAVKQ